MKEKSESIWLKANKANPATIKCAVTDHFLIRTPVPIVFFYQHAIPSQTIINAIQFALNDYPVFAGRMRKQNGHLYIHCNNAGVRFTIQSHSSSILQLLSNLSSQPNTMLVDMIKPKNILKEKEPVLTIQLTEFADGGTALGFCWNHCVGDMMSFMSFLKQASNFMREKESILAEITSDRDAYLERHLQNQCMTHSAKTSAELTYMKNRDLMKLILFLLKHRNSKQGVNFYFSENEIQSMKSDYEKKLNCPLSRNDVLCAHIMQILSTLSLEARANALSIVINYRSRIGLPENLLGNFISALKIPSNTDTISELLARKIRESILHYHENHFNYSPTHEYIRQQGGVRSINRILPTMLLPKQKCLIVTNWCRFGIYDITFGVKKPLFVIPFGESPLPWVSSIMPGLQGKGLLFSMVLPKVTAREIRSPKILEKIHAYRLPQEELSAEFLQCDWIM